MCRVILMFYQRPVYLLFFNKTPAMYLVSADSPVNYFLYLKNLYFHIYKL